MQSVPTIGHTIPDLTREPDEVQLFLFSAVTWNAHRIHFDRVYAISEGHKDVVVQTHLHACYLTEASLTALGPSARLDGLAWQNRHVAFAGDRLTVSGRIASVEESDDRLRIGIELEERNQNGELCVKGSAQLLVPTNDAEAPRR
jgi:hydroxyacyl-ACP dehydratase HTD2-like protein with hotdog domain